MPDKQTKLFVIGNPRSGTSLLRIILNSHESIVVPPECGFVQWWYTKYQNWNKNSDISEFMADLKTSKKIETWHLDFEKLQIFLNKESPETYESLVFSIIKFYGLSNKSNSEIQVLGDKNNYYINHLDVLKNISPSSKFLFIIRDPRDIYCSYKKIAELSTNSKYVPQLPQSIEEFNKSWYKNQIGIQDFIEDIPEKEYYFLNYEDLIFKPEITLSKVCNFLGIKYDSKMLEFYKTNDEPKELLDWKKKTLKPLDKTSVGTYKTYLSVNETKAIEEATFSLYRNFSIVV